MPSHLIDPGALMQAAPSSKYVVEDVTLVSIKSANSTTVSSQQEGTGLKPPGTEGSISSLVPPEKSPCIWGMSYLDLIGSLSLYVDTAMRLSRAYPEFTKKKNGKIT